jgi:hypothetical protein
MRRWHAARAGFMVFAIALGAMLVLAASLVYSQPERGLAGDTQVAKYLGADTCRLCHEDGPRGQFKDDFVRLTEYKVWKKDKHSQAYEVLRGARSQQMGTLLDIADVTKDARCLNCHAANVPVALRQSIEGQAYKLEDGVSCDACHGPSSLWLTPHFTEPGWRTKASTEKKKLGFFNVRDPAERAQICLSCHLGNGAEGKIITHDMLAAGHPPLPSIEVATFGESMPRHWRTMKEKGPKIWAAFHMDPDKELEQTRLVVVGGAVALRAALDLLAFQAEKDPRESAWPELARMDCYACHHDLKTESWRQKRGYAGRPGRPQMLAWPGALGKLAVRYAGEDEARLVHNERTLAQAFSVQPFGARHQVASAAHAFSQWSNSLVQRLEGKIYDQAAARGLLRGLCTLAQDEVLDYDSARQIVWAFQAIYHDLEPKPNDAAIQKIFHALAGELKLDLPSGTERTVVSELAEQWKKVGEYNPYRFQSLVAELAKQLPRD